MSTARVLKMSAELSASQVLKMNDELSAAHYFDELVDQSISEHRSIQGLQSLSAAH